MRSRESRESDSKIGANGWGQTGEEGMWGRCNEKQNWEMTQDKMAGQLLLMKRHLSFYSNTVIVTGLQTICVTVMCHVRLGYFLQIPLNDNYDQNTNYLGLECGVHVHALQLLTPLPQQKHITQRRCECSLVAVHVYIANIHWRVVLPEHPPIRLLCPEFSLETCFLWI